MSRLLHTGLVGLVLVHCVGVSGVGVSGWASGAPAQSTRTPAARTPARHVQPLTKPAEVGAALESATSEVMLVTPALRSKAVAEALRLAATERGVRIYLIADVRYAAEGSSYLSGLSLTKGVQVRLLRGLVESRATIDRRVTVAGPLLSGTGSVGPTLLDGDLRRTTRSAAWFSGAWASARPFRYQLPPPPTAPRK